MFSYLQSEELRATDLAKMELTRRRGVRSVLFPAQVKAISDPSFKKYYWCTRRAGKTIAALADCVEDGLKHPGSAYRYVALTREQADDIAWSVLNDLCRMFAPDYRPQEGKYRIVLPGGSLIRLYGADKSGWLDRLHGTKNRRVIFDEAPFFTIDLKKGIEEVVMPTLADSSGTLILMGRPGYEERGHCFDICKGLVPGWTLHRWTWEDNPHVKDSIQKQIDSEVAANPLYLQDPATRRNWFNEWCSDKSDLVYKYEAHLNNFSGWDWDDAKARAKDKYVIGLDIGHDDKTAISVCCWREDDPNFYVIECWAERDPGLTRLVDMIKYYSLEFPTARWFGDASNAFLFQEVKRRMSTITINAAEKTDKRHWIELYNAELTQGRAKYVNPHENPEIREMLGLRWHRALRTQNMVEEPGQPNDCCDARLYAFRHSYHFRQTIKEYHEETPKDVANKQAEMLKKQRLEFVKQKNRFLSRGK